MPIQPGSTVYTQGFGSRPEDIEVPHLDVRPPNATDTQYPIGKRWLDTVLGNEYVLGNLSSAGGVLQANWAFLGGTSGDLNTLTTNDNTVVMPSAGNINLSGAGSITTVGAGATATVELTGLTNHAVLVGAGTTTITKLGVGTTGQVLVGSTGADPAFQDLGVNSNLTGLVVGNTNSAFTTTTFTTATAFTPAFSLGTPGDSAWTYSTQFGRYTRVGAIVYFVAEVVWTNFTNTTGSGNWQLNIPVTSGAFTRSGHVHISGSGIDAAAETANLPVNFVCEVGSGVSNIVLSVEEGGVGNAANALFDLTVSQVKTSGTMTVSGWYFAA